MKSPEPQYGLPHDSLLQHQAGLRTDYLDIYSRAFTTPCPVCVDSAVKQFFFSIPRPFLWMLAVREAVARPLGLKTANGKKATLLEIKRFEGNVGERIALFEVWNRTEKEIVTGQRDKHLDFILSFYLETRENQYTLKLFTVIQFNSRLGRAYFLVVKPIHRLLMPVLVRRLCHRLVHAC